MPDGAGSARYHDLVVGIDPAEIDVAPRQEGNHAGTDAHEHETAVLGALGHPPADPHLIRRPAPRIRKVRVDRDLKVDSISLDIDYELRLFRLPFRAKARILHPQA